MGVMFRRGGGSVPGFVKYGGLVLLAVVAVVVTAAALQDSGPLLQPPSVSLPEWWPTMGLWGIF